MRYEFHSQVWRSDGPAAWHFATLPRDLTAGIEALRGPASAWGSVRVTATTGGASWRTSLFPDSRRGAFLLPLKADVRRRERIEAGQTRLFVVELEQ